MSRTLCKKLGKHMWLWPWQHTKRCAVCGAVKNLCTGENTISANPGGVGDVMRWSGTQPALNEGDIGMDTSSGRPSAYIHLNDRDLIHIDESMVQMETQRLSAPQTVVTMNIYASGVDIAVAVSGSFLSRNDGTSTLIEMRPAGWSVAGTDYDVIERTRYTIGGATSENHVGHNAHGIMYLDFDDEAELHEGWFQSFFWVIDDQAWLTINTQSGFTEHRVNDIIVTSHAYTRMFRVEDFSQIEIDANSSGFFQPASRFTVAWWPMKIIP